MMCCCIHQKHTQQHDVTCDASGLRVMNFNSCLWSDLVPFNIEEIHVMCAYMYAGEEE